MPALSMIQQNSMWPSIPRLFAQEIRAIAPPLLGLSAGSCLHFFTETQWPHICPYLFDVRQAFCFCSGLSCIVPAQCIFPVRRPDRVLLFMVDHDLVDSEVFAFVVSHAISPSDGCQRRPGVREERSLSCSTGA